MLATLDVSSGAIRSVADLPAGAAPGGGRRGAGSLDNGRDARVCRAAATEPAAGVPTPIAALGTARPARQCACRPFPGRTDPHVLGDSAVLPVAPATGCRAVPGALDYVGEF